jgi:hypothetical protein
MYIYRKRHKKVGKNRCARKNARLKAKNRNRVARAHR